MLDRRIKMLPFLLAVIALAVVGVYATSAAWDSSRPLGLAVGLALYALQFPLVRWRANDLGRPPDDIVWLLVPGLGQVFVLALLGRTPADKVRAKKMKRWQGQITGGGAFLLGMRRLVRVWWLALPLALLFGVVETVVGEELLTAVSWMEGLSSEARAPLFQGLAILTGALGVYSLFQLVKRKVASRLSWMPSLFMLPTGLVAGTVYLAGVPSTEPARLALAYSAWTLLFACIGGASLAVAWITIAQQLHQGEVDAMVVVRRIFARTTDVAAPHGAKVHAVQIGLQVVVPGIFYAVQMAFVDMAAVLEPDQPALRRSAKLTWGIRTRILKALLLGVLVSMGIGLAATWYFEGAAGVQQGLIVPGSIGMWPTLVGDVVGILVFGGVLMGLLDMYRERVERVERKEVDLASIPSAISPDETPAGARSALVLLGLLMVGLGVVLLVQAGTGAALVSGGGALAVLALLVGGRGE